MTRFIDWYVYRSPPGRLIAWLAATRPFQAMGKMIGG